MSLADVKAKLVKLEQAEAIERALHLAERAATHAALVSRIVAEDAAESERSIALAFTAEESAAIFGAVAAALRPRLEALKAELGA